MIKVSEDFVEYALRARYREVEKYGWTSDMKAELFEQLIDVVKTSEVITDDQSVIVDNFLVNGSFYTKEELLEQIVREEYPKLHDFLGGSSPEDIVEYDCDTNIMDFEKKDLRLIRKFNDEVDLDERWQKFCEDCLFSTDKYACKAY